MIFCAKRPKFWYLLLGIMAKISLEPRLKYTMDGAEIWEIMYNLGLILKEPMSGWTLLCEDIETHPSWVCSNQRPTLYFTNPTSAINSEHSPGKGSYTPCTCVVTSACQTHPWDLKCIPMLGKGKGRHAVETASGHLWLLSYWKRGKVFYVYLF